jgi:hypothetical protein
MTAENIRAILAQHRGLLDAGGVVSLALFGSTARGDAGPDSDIDLLVEVREGVGLLTFLALQSSLTRILERRVDLVPRDGLKARFRDQVLSEAIRVA